MKKIKEITRGIGLMSGTSLDGVDLVFVEFTSLNTFKLLQAETVSYPEDWFLKLKDIALFEKGSIELKAIDVGLGNYFGILINDFVKKNQLQNIDWIASHGHTVHHQPEIRYTLQIGCGKEIFKRTGIKTVYDFRSQDVLLGGQGAPLVPIGDLLLFSEYDYCLNLGLLSDLHHQIAEKKLLLMLVVVILLL